MHTSICKHADACIQYIQRNENRIKQVKEQNNFKVTSHKQCEDCGLSNGGLVIVILASGDQPLICSRRKNCLKFQNQ